jgi:hypothetical protein
MPNFAVDLIAAHLSHVTLFGPRELRCARIVVDRFGGEVRGYWHDDNRYAAVGETEGGHDFAITHDQLLVDPWLFQYYGEKPVLDLTKPEEKAESLLRYGNPEKWSLVYAAQGKPGLTGIPAEATFHGIMERATMTSENNLHVSDELLTQLQATAAANGKTTDELAEEAVRRLLEHQALDNLAARGATHAERVGRKPADAVAAVREVRRGR